jgi:hypothetical protein
LQLTLLTLKTGVRLNQHVSQGIALGIGNTLLLSAFLTKVHLLDLVIDDLGKMHRGDLAAELTF